MNARRLTIIVTLFTTLFLLGRLGWDRIRKKDWDVGQPKSAEAIAKVTPAPVELKDVVRGGPYQGQKDVRWKTWREMEKADRSFEWKMPIRFYGVVVDENDIPVPDATIRFGWNDVSGSHERFGKSGLNGKFALTGVRGKILTVKASKAGYHSSGSKAGQAFEYAAFFEPIYHEPDESRPVVFRLVKKLEAERLIRQRVFKKLSYESKWYFDLQTGLIARTPPIGPGLSFYCERSESSRSEPYDWKLDVEGIQLVVQPINVEFPQMAPESDYTKGWEVVQLADAKPFKSDWQVRLFVRTDANTYGWLELEIMHPNDRAIGPAIGVTSYLNPTGSRVIELETGKVSSNP